MVRKSTDTWWGRGDVERERERERQNFNVSLNVDG